MPQGALNSMAKSARVSDYPFSKFWRIYMSAILCTISLFLSLLMIKFNDVLSWGLYFLFAFLTTVFSIYIKLKIYFKREKSPNSLYNSSTGMKWRFLIFYLMLIFPFLFLPAILATLLSPNVWFTSINGYVFGINIGELLLFLQEKRRKS
jgi:ABC-type Na+ efflux pump permease subunit